MTTTSLIQQRLAALEKNGLSLSDSRFNLAQERRNPNSFSTSTTMSSPLRTAWSLRCKTDNKNKSVSIDHPPPSQPKSIEIENMHSLKSPVSQQRQSFERSVPRTTVFNRYGSARTLNSAASSSGYTEDETESSMHMDDLCILRSSSGRQVMEEPDDDRDLYNASFEDQMRAAITREQRRKRLENQAQLKDVPPGVMSLKERRQSLLKGLQHDADRVLSHETNKDDGHEENEVSLLQQKATNRIQGSAPPAAEGSPASNRRTLLQRSVGIRKDMVATLLNQEILDSHICYTGDNSFTPFEEQLRVAWDRERQRRKSEANTKRMDQNWKD